jgi:hypothetical protein
MRATEITINEVANNPYDYELDQDGAQFIDKDGNSYSIKFMRIESGVFAVAFSSGIFVDQKTNRHDSFRIFATVIDAIKSYATKNDVAMIVFSANKSEPNRVNLYKKLALAFTRNSNYKLIERSAEITDAALQNRIQYLFWYLKTKDFTPFMLVNRKFTNEQGVAEGLEHNQQDLKDVADWMNTTPDKLSVTVKQEPIEKFIKQIREMYGTYDEFPEDKKRTNRILKLLKRGAKPLPIYVEANDPYLFVMEGRHRMVAFWLEGMKTIPVAYVSINSQQGVTEGLDQDIPEFLYHATYRPLLKSIKQHGLGGDKAQAKWEDSKPGVVYLATDPNVAESYAETSDVVPDEWLDQIVILKISTNGLENKIQIDRNVQDNEGDTLEYHGIIPLSNISMYKQGVSEDTLNEVRCVFARSRVLIGVGAF